MIATALQLGAELPEIVDLAIENDPDFLRTVRHGLMPSSQVDNREASEAESERTGKIIPLVIRSPMGDRPCHPGDGFRANRLLTDKVKLAADSAHNSSPIVADYY